MARAMSANLGEGANQGPTATYDFIKAKITILGEGGQVCNSQVGANDKGGGEGTHSGGISAPKPVSHF